MRRKRRTADYVNHQSSAGRLTRVFLPPDVSFGTSSTSDFRRRQTRTEFWKQCQHKVAALRKPSSKVTVTLSFSLLHQRQVPVSVQSLISIFMENPFLSYGRRFRHETASMQECQIPGKNWSGGKVQNHSAGDRRLVHEELRSQSIRREPGAVTAAPWAHVVCH